ncbi:hypothetical protein Ancab_007507 [Ancistrocladus abbreviatus]
MQEKKYGLQLRVPPSQQKKQPTRPPLPKAPGFSNDDEDDVEKEISRQASKNKSLKDIEEQHKKALEEDPSVFDYDGVYEEMKDKVARPQKQDRQERKPKYIQALMDKAKQREREHEIVYERKLAKERSKDDHLFADKDKFVTNAYKRKLAEQANWLQEERLRELREEKEDVTKKSDISDFYFNLSKNVAFGAKDTELPMPEKQEQEPVAPTPERDHSVTISPVSSPSRSGVSNQGGALLHPRTSLEPVAHAFEKERPSTIPSSTDLPQEPKHDHHKRSDDAVAAAKERFLARKRAREQ